MKKQLKCSNFQIKHESLKNINPIYRLLCLIASFRKRQFPPKSQVCYLHSSCNTACSRLVTIENKQCERQPFDLASTDITLLRPILHETTNSIKFLFWCIGFDSKLTKIWSRNFNFVSNCLKGKGACAFVFIMAQ